MKLIKSLIIISIVIFVSGCSKVTEQTETKIEIKKEQKTESKENGEIKMDDFLKKESKTETDITKTSSDSKK